jgi:uncharacterized membrane protein
MNRTLQRLSKASVFAVLACTLLCIRMMYSGEITFAFLLWNLTLAWIPFRLMKYLSDHPHFTGIKMVSVFILWGLFLPNAPYILTDLIHLKISPSPLIWLDILMLFLFSLSGLHFGFESIKMAVRTIEIKLGKFYGNLLSTAALISCGFGIYLGRVERLNSWDLMIHPLKITREITSIYFGALFPWAFSLLMGLVLFVLYHRLFNHTTYEKES